jgi:tetratricopeptide (TPR) repeat protein
MSGPTFDMAMHLVSLGRSEEALRKLGESFDPEDPWQWWLRGVALLDLERVDEAIDAVGQGLNLEPEAAALLALLARCRLLQDDLVEAEQAVLAALRADAEDADNLALYARIVAGAGQLEKARKLVARARQLDPENENVVRMQSVLAIARGDEREALLHSRELLAIDPENVYAHRIAGAVLHDRGDVDAAAGHFRTAVVSDPAERETVEMAHENLLWRNPFMWPLRPVQRFGIAPVWIAGVATMYGARLVSRTAAGIVAVLWLTYCVYSWVVPSLVRRHLRRR